MYFTIFLTLLACSFVTKTDGKSLLSAVNYTSIGCFFDTHYVLDSLEGRDPLLDGDYETRENAVDKCALAAKKWWRNVFAIAHGGKCLTTFLSPETKPNNWKVCEEHSYYTKYEVYVIEDISQDTPLPEVNYTSIGCYHDKAKNPAFSSLEGQSPLLQDDYQTRGDAIQKCAVAVAASNSPRFASLFAIQDGGKCLGGEETHRTFNKHGTSQACAQDGKGGQNANHVYIIGKVADLPFESAIPVGCYKDLPLRAIPSMEGKDPILDGNYTTREDAFFKCNVVAKTRGYSVFALQDGGMCLAGPSRPATKYGWSRDCKKDGKGGPMANHVYAMNTAVFDYLSNVDYESLGCYKDEPRRAMDSLEGQDVLLKDNYKLRKDAIQKCALLTKVLGYTVFGIQDGGMCVGSANAIETFDKYGVSQNCRNDGRGGPMANEVYALRSHRWKNILNVNSFYYNKVGCMKSNWMESMEGKDATLDGNPAVRELAAEKCGLVSLKRGYKVYTVHNGTCSGGPTAVQTFLRHGYHDSDSNCWSAPARSVYVLGLIQDLIHFVNYTHLGCFKASLHLIPSVEGLSFASFYTWDNYKRRASAIQKCALYAQLKHFKVFALQDGGKCLTGPKAHNLRFDRRVRSKNCGQEGKGGKSAIDVYAVKS